MPSRQLHDLHRTKFDTPHPLAPSDEGAVGVSRLRERKIPRFALNVKIVEPDSNHPVIAKPVRKLAVAIRVP